MTSQNSPPDASGFDARYAQAQLRRARSPWRRFVRGFYLRNIVRRVRGPTVDFGCGAGQLLERLAPGSVGLELNPRLLENLRAAGFEVHPTRGSPEDFDLAGLGAGRFESLVISHVLEHLADPVDALARLLRACARLGIARVVVVVPGRAGFRSDATHRTFIDRRFIERHLPALPEGFVRTGPGYFPLPWAWFGEFFVYQEMVLTFERSIPAPARSREAVGR